DLVVLAGRPVRGGRRLLWSVLRERQGVVRPGVRAGAGRNALGGDLGRAPALGGPGQPREHGRRLRVLAGVPDGARGGLLFAQAALVRLVGGQGGELSAVAGLPLRLPPRLPQGDDRLGARRGHQRGRPVAENRAAARVPLLGGGVGGLGALLLGGRRRRQRAGRHVLGGHDEVVRQQHDRGHAAVRGPLQRHVDVVPGGQPRDDEQAELVGVDEVVLGRLGEPPVGLLQQLV